MARPSVRTHIVVPRDLVESVDELVGRRARSRFFAEAVEEKLARAHLAQTARRVAGSLAEVEVPGWETSESAARWIRDSRRAGERLPHQTTEGE
jgi:metal-responsive CopG/Arc/MetJ family transcriptional regulator